MIYHKEQINSNHHIDNVKPDWLIELPFKEGEVFSANDVTCIFSIDEYLKPKTLKPVGVEYYEQVDHVILENERFGSYIPRYVYVFKGKPFNIEETKERLLNSK